MSYNCNVTPIFGRRADHCRAADVDIFDGFFETDAVFLYRLFKRIQIYDDEIDRFNAVVLHRNEVLRMVAKSEESSVYFGVQGLYAAVHHLGESGYVRNIGNL